MAIAGAGGWWIYSRTIEPYRGYTEPEVLSIFRRASTGRDRQSPGEAGVVRDPPTFQVALLISGRSRVCAPVVPVRHRRPCASTYDKIARGDVYRRRLTFREGLTIAEMAGVFEERGFGKADEFIRRRENAALIHDLDPGARTTSRAICSPRATPCRAARAPRRWWRKWWMGSRT